MTAVFFYGGLINPRQLRRLGVSPRAYMHATLHGHAVTIAPWVNIQPDANATVFGLIMDMSQEELARIYGQLHVVYRPREVVVTTMAGDQKTVLCFVADAMQPGPAEREHVLMLLEAAEQLGFPAWYQERIRAFLPPAPGDAGGNTEAS